MMREAAGLFEKKKYTRVSIVHAKEKKSEKNSNMCQISSCFPKVERYYMSKELTWDKRPNKSHIYISWLPQNLYPSPKQHLATVLAVWAETDLSVNGQNSFSSGLQVVGVVGFIPT